jgi:hypothetical protein
MLCQTRPKIVVVRHLKDWPVSSNLHEKLSPHHNCGVAIGTIGKQYILDCLVIAGEINNPQVPAFYIKPLSCASNNADILVFTQEPNLCFEPVRKRNIIRVHHGDKFSLSQRGR